MQSNFISQTIQQRHTAKVLADPKDPWPVPNNQVRDKVVELLEVAVAAPYHFPADKSHRTEPLASPVPWRFHALDGQNCRWLLKRLQEAEVEGGKIFNMLAAADALVLTTWLPDPPAEPLGFQQYDPTLRNMEHIAAASAAIQNLLLLATDAGWLNYWSSGGVLRSEMVYELAGINTSEVLLGAVFLFPAETGEAMVKPGANRDRQGPTESWARWVHLTQ